MKPTKTKCLLSPKLRTITRRNTKNLKTKTNPSKNKLNYSNSRTKSSRTILIISQQWSQLNPTLKRIRIKINKSRTKKKKRNKKVIYTNRAS